MKNVAAAIATIPAASPSNPSTRLIAFAAARTHRIVSGTASSVPSTASPSPGSTKYASWTPSRTRMPAMKICAVSFASAEVPRRSSITPSPTISVHATTAPSGSTAVAFIGSKNGRSRDTPIATRKPPHIASPPIVGVGTTWSFRSEG